MLGVPLASQLLTGCIIPDPPEYGPPQQTPIFIEEAKISPSKHSVLFVNTVEDTEPISFGFTVRSEDAGDRLWAALYADYKHTGGMPLQAFPYDPLTLDEERSISIRLSPKDGRLNPPKCYAITLLVVHEQGFDIPASKPKPTASDLTGVTWLLSLANEQGAPSLDTCPNSSDEVTETSN